VRTNTLWSGFGGGCQSNDDGDATVVYDHLADRWVVTQFSVSTTPFLQCVAVSTSGDPTGSYYRYAFQYTNFLRDVAEDLDRGRVYLPQEELRRFGVTPANLGLRRVTPEWRAFLASEIERARGLYDVADRGLSWLPARSARCVLTARVLYARILDRIEAADYDVFSIRARVPTWRKASTAARILISGA
jgi:hypothetical protein